jgi:hypothetical protein
MSINEMEDPKKNPAEEPIQAASSEGIVPEDAIEHYVEDECCCCHEGDDACSSTEHPDHIETGHPDHIETEQHPDHIEEESPIADEHHSALGSHQKLSFDDFKTDLNALTDPEEKLRKAISFMELSLGQGGVPQFKLFWDTRTICMEIFKENITPSVRAQLWLRYSELSKEARRLKEILDEQSAFAAEQIEIAIQALETDINSFDECLQKIQEVEFVNPPKAIQQNYALYCSIQRQLNLLNAQASRINALRKELIRTEMRVRQKNKFFQRLSVAGDKVFPKRKELIKEISQHFSHDVEIFIKENFSEEELGDSLFFLREEIKALQGIAKVLTLNTHSFTQTRMRLSECWDNIKVIEKERKKVRAQQKVIFKENADFIQSKLEDCAKLFEDGELSIQEANKMVDNIAGEMRNVEIGKDEIKSLRYLISKVREPILERLKAEEQGRIEQGQEKERAKRQKVQEIRNEIAQLLHSTTDNDVEFIEAQRDALFEKINDAPTSKLEKQELERQLKSLKDIIADKKEKALLLMPETDRQALQQLKELLKQKRERRAEIKTQIETLRKASGGSGLDFEQAMKRNAQMAEEKELLDKTNQGIKEIEQKIAEFERSIS